MYWQYTIAGFEQRPLSWPTVTAVVLLHVLAILLLATSQEVIPPEERTPIIVRLIEQAPAVPDIQPVVLPVRQSPPTPVAKPKQPAQPAVAQPASVVDSPIVASALASVTTPAAVEPPPAEPAVAKADPPPVSASVQPDPVAPKPREEPVEQPRFDADYLDNPSPGYPPLSRKLREEGQVLLRVRVTAEGRAEQVNLHRSSGFERLDERAVHTVRQWKFMPARQGGKPVDAWVIVPIQFSLKG